MRAGTRVWEPDKQLRDAHRLRQSLNLLTVAAVGSQMVMAVQAGESGAQGRSGGDGLLDGHLMSPSAAWHRLLHRASTGE